ncbi:MAG: caspase family protein [Gallionellaceae bacterium]|nr:caspase family protein [Gallionellaceae bacterium]
MNIRKATLMKLFKALIVTITICGYDAAQATQSKAVVIGISQYTEINSLRYADSDAREFSQILIDLAGYEKSDVSLLLNQEATKKRIVDEINKVVRESQKHPLDSFILMFAGHGIESTLTAANTRKSGLVKETNIFLAPFDASIDENNFYSTGNGKEVSNETFINKAWLARQLSAIKAKSIFIILDSCYSGTKSFGSLFLENEGYSIQSFGVSGSNNGVASVEKRALTLLKSSADSKSTPEINSNGRRIAYLASSKEDQTSAEYDELQHGALSYCIFEYIKRVRREAKQNERVDISIEDLYENITTLFHKTKVNGVPLDSAHQPLLVPIPDFSDMKDMVMVSVTGTNNQFVAVQKIKSGSLTILTRETMLSDIEIYVDGLKRGESINTKIFLPEGRHSIEIYLPKTGYRNTFIADISETNPFTKKIELRGELYVASLWLIEGVKSEGPILDVLVDGKKVSNSPMHLDDLIAGSHRVEVNYKDVSKIREIEIRPDSPLRINYTIVKKAAESQEVQRVRNVVF